MVSEAIPQYNPVVFYIYRFYNCFLSLNCIPLTIPELYSQLEQRMQLLFWQICPGKTVEHALNEFIF